MTGLTELWEPASDGVGRLPWFITRLTPAGGGSRDFVLRADHALLRFGSQRTAQNRADWLNRQEMP